MRTIVEPLRIGMDLDGVLADFSSVFHRVARGLFPSRVPEFYTQTRWNMEDTDITPEQLDSVWEMIKDARNFWEHLPAYTSNLEALASFLRLGRYNNRRASEIIYLTARVPTFGEPVATQSANWLRERGLFPAGCSVLVKPTGVTKTQIYDALGVPVSLDDCLENIIQSKTHTAILLDRPWNRDGRAASVPVVKSVAEYLDLVLSALGTAQREVPVA